MEAEKKQLFKSVSDWVAAQSKAHIKRNMLDDAILTELELCLYFAIGIPSVEIFNFLLDVKRKRPRASEKLDINAKIVDILARYPLLGGMTASSAIYLRDAVCSVMHDDLQATLDEVARLSNTKIPAEHTECYLMFSQHVCAAAEYADGWVFFKVRFAQFLLDNKRIDEARTAVEELEQLLPDDPEIKELRDILNAI